MGIFLAAGFEYAWLSAKDFTEQHFVLSSRFIKKHYRYTKLALRTFVTSVLGDSEDHEPLLPTTYPVNPIRSDSTLPSTPARNSEGSDGDESLLSSEDGHTAELFSLGPNPWIL